MQNLYRAQTKLIGKTINSVRLMSDDEMEYFGWTKRTLVIMLDDGTFIIPQRDDEANDGGAIAVIHKSTLSIFGTL